MRDTAPFWTYATLCSQTEEPNGFRVSLEDMVSDSGRLVEGDFATYDAKGPQFAPGDVLFGKLRPYLAKYWLADRAGTAGGDIHVYRPAENVEPRFLSYVVGSRDFVRYADAASKGVKMPRAEWTAIREFRVTRFDAIAQRRIADYLDREVGAINAMVGKLDELVATLGDRRRAMVDLAFRNLAAGSTVAIQIIADVTVGIVVEPAKLYVDSGQGVPALRGLNVAPGAILSDSVVEISREGHAANLKSELRTGDLVTVRTGRVGTTAVITEEWNGANAIDLVITRLRAGWVPGFLFWYLQSTVALEQIDVDSVGSVQSHFNVGALKRLRIPDVSPPEQTRIAEQLDAATSKIQAMENGVAVLRGLLNERRAALITDIVSGSKEVDS